MSSSVKAAIHLGLNHAENLETCNNMNFEQIQNLFDITKKWVLDNPEEILNVKTIEKHITMWDEIDVSSRPSDSMDQSQSASLLRFRAVWERCLTAQKQAEDGQVKWSIQNVHRND